MVETYFLRYGGKMGRMLLKYSEFFVWKSKNMSILKSHVLLIFLFVSS